MPKSHFKAIHIFRAGSHTAMQGQQLHFSEADLAASARAYDPAKHEAPLVIGHPAGNAPAYGWVSGLAVNDEGLFATPRQVEPQFAEAVAQGRHKKVSASFYAPNSPHNPVPGVYYLRHVGFLGGQPPAIKGLAPVEFADGGQEDDGVVTLEFAESPAEAEGAGLVRRYTAALRDLLGFSAGSVLAPSFREPQPQPQSEDKPMPRPNPTPPVQDKITDAPSASGAAAAQRVADLERQLASFQEQQRRSHAQGIVSTALIEGRLTPAQTTGLVDFMATLSDEADALCFGEGDQAHKTSPLAYITGFIASLPRQVDFTEQSADQHVAAGLTPEQAAREALCYQEGLRQKGIVISVTDAMAAVKAGTHKEATRG